MRIGENSIMIRDLVVREECSFDQVYLRGAVRADLFGIDLMISSTSLLIRRNFLLLVWILAFCALDLITFSALLNVIFISWCTTTRLELSTTFPSALDGSADLQLAFAYSSNLGTSFGDPLSTMPQRALIMSRPIALEQRCNLPSSFSVLCCLYGRVWVSL